MSEIIVYFLFVAIALASYFFGRYRREIYSDQMLKSKDEMILWWRGLYESTKANENPPPIKVNKP